MGATQEMIKQNVFDWLDALVVGVKAMHTVMPCGTDGWKDEASVYNHEQNKVDGMFTVHIHNVEAVAKAIEVDVQHAEYTVANEYYGYFSGEDFFIYNDVKFVDMTNSFTEEEADKRKAERREYEKKRNEREQGSDSGTSENISVADE